MRERGWQKLQRHRVPQPHIVGLIDAPIATELPPLLPGTPVSYFLSRTASSDRMKRRPPETAGDGELTGVQLVAFGDREAACHGRDDDRLAVR